MASMILAGCIPPRTPSPDLIPDPPEDPTDPSAFAPGKEYAALFTDRGYMRDASVRSIVGIAVPGPSRDADAGAENVERRGMYLFPPVVSGPLFMNVTFAPKTKGDGRNCFVFAYIGGTFTACEPWNRICWQDGGHDECPGNEEVVDSQIFLDDINTFSLYQNGRDAWAFVNGRFISRHETPVEPPPRRVGFGFRTTGAAAGEALFTDFILATGRTAWGFKEAAANSAGPFGMGSRGAEDRFEITVNGGFDPGKSRTVRDAGTMTAYRTFEADVEIRPRDDAGLAYPAYLNVIYWLRFAKFSGSKTPEGFTSDHWDFVLRSHCRQYVLQSPGSFVKDRFSEEYTDYHVEGNPGGTLATAVDSVPQLDVWVTGTSR
ncbi:MAG: hypothetical protein LBR80_05245 [Deltaproteobacteria bacterium]|nr:hypothetical protein [Deltaproteobacteria bacterium]